MTSPTPGPWVSMGVCVVALDASPQRVVCSATFGDYRSAPSFDEAVANARLMGAAPEMLAALKAALALAVELLSIVRMNDEDGDVDVQANLAALEAVILKAEAEA